MFTFSAETLPQQLARWQKLNELYPSSSQTIHKFDDGWSVQHHPVKRDTWRIGSMMRNCWQGGEGAKRDLNPHAYEAMANKSQASDAHRFMSLHDPQGLPRVAFYVKNPSLFYGSGPNEQYITNALGARNTLPTADDHRRLSEYAHANGYKVDDWDYKEPQLTGTLGEPVHAALPKTADNIDEILKLLGENKALRHWRWPEEEKVNEELAQRRQQKHMDNLNKLPRHTDLPLVHEVTPGERVPSGIKDLDQRRPYYYEPYSNQVFLGPYGVHHAAIEHHLPEQPGPSVRGYGYVIDPENTVGSYTPEIPGIENANRAVAQHLGPPYIPEEDQAPAKFNFSKVEEDEDYHHTLVPWKPGQSGKGYYHLPSRKVVTWINNLSHGHVIQQAGGSGYNDSNMISFAIPSGGAPYIYPMPDNSEIPPAAKEAIERHVGASEEKGFNFSKTAGFEEIQDMFSPYLLVNAHETPSSIRFDTIDTTPKDRGKGYGTRFMKALKHYADQTGKRVIVDRVENASFFDKFPWLKQAEGQSRVYDPQGEPGAFGDSTQMSPTSGPVWTPGPDTQTHDVQFGNDSYGVPTTLARVAADYGNEQPPLPPHNHNLPWKAITTNDGEHHICGAGEYHNMYMNRVGISPADVKAYWGWDPYAYKWQDYGPRNNTFNFD